MCIERLLSAVFYVMLCKPARPALQPHYSDRNIEAGKSEITQGLGSPQPGETPVITTTWARSGCERGPFPVQPLHPQQNLGKEQSGTLRAAGGDSRPPPGESPGRLARWKSRARPEPRLGCREIRRKKLLLFFFFSGIRGHLPGPRAPSSRFSPPRGAPPHGAPPPPRRRPTAELSALSVVLPPIGGVNDSTEATPQPSSL